MKSGGSHLSLDERKTIEALLKCGYSKKEIAEKLGRHPATIYHEIERCSKAGIQYNADAAEKNYRHKVESNGPTPKLSLDKDLAEYIGHLIGTLHMSVEDAVSELRSPSSPLNGRGVNGATIRSSIKKGLIPGVTMQTLTANRGPTIIGKGGIVRIPAAMREEMDLRPGDNVLLERINENEIRLRVTDRKERCISDR